MIHLVYPHRFLLGPLKYPGEIKNRDYANFWGAKKVYYGRCKNGEWNLKQREWVTSVTFSLSTLWWLSLRPYDVPTTTSFINVPESHSLQSVFVSSFWFLMWNGKRHISGTCRRSTKDSPKVKTIFENISCLLFPFEEVPVTFIYTVHSFSSKTKEY